ncbi:hypothetical protein ACFYWU_34405 [Streptomyces chrestomyceticus]|uniref:hypothetical protein n=1 Tax=Streptomyces chrestomyceticus TaxID=68185 RepID=UPI0036BABA53
MTLTIDDLLADAYVPTTSPTAFDIGAALRRLAADAAQAAPTPDMARAALAGQRLGVVSRWVLNGPGAAGHVGQLAEAEGAGPHAALEEEEVDVAGALVYACLLHLTGHPESAQFWWQLAAGADSRAAAYCLHLHHLHLGESREARHWYHQLTHSMTDETSCPDDAFIEGLEAGAHYVRANGTMDKGPTGELEEAVDRLAARSSACPIVPRPDRRLADRLHQFAGRR